MKIALCTTTIHVPHALKLLRKCSADVHFFVAGDEKTPLGRSLGRECIVQQVLGISDPNWSYFDLYESAGWKCSNAIGRNTIARRNIAFLEALKWGADVIYSWDDDNYPIDTAHFWHLENCAFETFHGIRATGAEGWFDPGAYLSPPARHRGFPIQKKHVPIYTPVTDVKVGVAASLILNDPDIDATHRIERAPAPQQVSRLVEAGMVVDPATWTIFNTQSTAMIRELIPAWFLMPNVGRHDDIYASLIVQCVARERGLHVHFGQPFVIQQRHQHDLLKDLRAEIDGMQYTVELAHMLDHIILPGKSVIEDVRRIYETLRDCPFLPRASVEAGLLWLEDVEGVL